MTGRNEPCPCGSGRKFKHCHGAAPPDADDDPERAVPSVLRWLSDRHRRALQEAITDIVASWWPDEIEMHGALEPELARMLMQNAHEWLLADDDLEVGDTHVRAIELVLATKQLHLGPRQRARLVALAAAPLRLYTVTDVRRGEGIVLADVLDADSEPRFVHERAGSETMKPGLLVGARVVPGEAGLELSGALYPFAPLWEARVTTEVRDASLGDGEADDVRYEIGHAIASAWLCSLVEPATLPQLVDASTGETLAFTIDRYAVDDARTVRAALARSPELAQLEPDHWTRDVVGDDGVTRPIATLTLDPAAATLEAFYRTRSHADRGRPWLDERLGDRVRFVARDSIDPRAAMQSARADARPTRSPRGESHPAPEVSLEAMADAVERVLRTTYANWADEPIPALGGKTPREAAATPAGAERVRGLLRSYEASEAEMARAQGRRAVDFAFLWETVGLTRR